MPETNEWEFQGEVLSWVNPFLDSHPLGIERATQEFTNPDGRRSDMVIWRDHAARDAVLAAEFKRPSFSFKSFEQDAVRKAQQAKAPYVALWNMRKLIVYRTPAAPRKHLLPDDYVADVGTVDDLTTVADWLKPRIREQLQQLSTKLILGVFDLLSEGAIAHRIVDPTVFVDWLGEQTRRLRVLVEKDFRAGLGANRRLRLDIRLWARKQGLEGFVADLDESLAAQLAYRLTGQILFYYALRRYEKGLPRLAVNSRRPIPDQLRDFWDAVRQFDYEALYEVSPLEQVPLSNGTQRAIRDLVDRLARYDWDAIGVDVLGSIFENMIPPHERRVLGQYYTPPQLADLLIALSLDTPNDIVFDPGVGTGTFLYRTYDKIRRNSRKPHAKFCPYSPAESRLASPLHARREACQRR